MNILHPDPNPNLNPNPNSNPQHSPCANPYPAHPDPVPSRPVWPIILTAFLTMVLTFGLTVLAGAAVLRNIGWIPGRAPQPTAGPSSSLTFAEDSETAAAVSKLREVLNQIKNNYYQKLSDAEILEAMTRGALSGLGNRYTFYLTAEQNQTIEQSLSGNYSGIGAIVGITKEGAIEVTELIHDGPAEQAGLLIGDVFLAVDDKDVTGIQDINSLAALVRGEEGTTVRLKVGRAGEEKARTIEVIRRRISNANISPPRMLEPGIGYIAVREFSGGVAANFRKAVQDLQNQGARHLVIDLRNNGGGLADEVIRMLDDLLPRADIASIRGRRDGESFTQVWRSGSGMIVPGSMTFACLVNGNTASASELFSGSLRDLGRAQLIGEQTFGKGSGTVSYELADKSAINLTNFLYYLPKGESIEGVGLTPDQIVNLPPETAGISYSRLTEEQDTQLAAARAALRAKMAA